MAALSSPFVRSFPGRTTLTRRDRIVVRALAEAMFAADGEVDSARLDAHVIEVDAYVSAASRFVRAGLRLALFVVRLAPLLFFYRACMLEQLEIEERVSLLVRLERSRLVNLSLAFIGWRTVMTLIFYEHPAELRWMGYRGEERTRHKRHLTTVPVVPVPLESGVRLTDPDADERDADDGSGSREVA